MNKSPDRALLWAERRQQARVGKHVPPKREKWAIAAMLAKGNLTIGQWRAALRLRKLIEQASRPAQTKFEYAPRTTTDPAESAYTAILARLAAGDALAAAQGSMEWANRQRVVRAAFDGEPTLSALTRLYCESSKNVERVRRILRAACEALEAHWAAVDSGNFRQDLGA